MIYLKLEKLYYCYGLDTSCFYTDTELAYEKAINRAKRFKAKLKSIASGNYHIQSKRRKKEIYEKYGNKEGKQKIKEIEQSYCEHWMNLFEQLDGGYKGLLSKVNKLIRESKAKLIEEQEKNLDLVRTVRYDKVHNRKGQSSMRRRVSIFDSVLTRCLNLQERKFNTEILIVKVFYFPVAHGILRNGFIMDGQRYVFFSASAGQIRTKKFVAVREDLLNGCWNTLTAGLTIERINECGGVNPNKYLAYTALTNSGTEVWEEFDIDRCIVVDDFETDVEGEVDYIDDVTFEITRQKTSLPIAHIDGCGIMLPSVSKKNFMVRLPWVKGLLATFDFRKFIEDNNASPVIKDVYGAEHNVIEEDIQIIFTKSQFKMWKYYKDWNDYKANYKKYGCTAGRCNMEEDLFPDAVINYQMIQTLCDLSDDEIDKLTEQSRSQITDIATEQESMLRTFGIKKYKPMNVYNGLQKCLITYPALLSDLYCRNALKDLKNKLETELWAAKFSIDGKYTFVVPDLYAFCEWLFLGINKPRGLLQDGEVSCKLFGDGEELDCLRSPHLYCEHAVRTNRANIEWFTTKAIYISSHDYISRILQSDSDGDKYLVSNNKILVDVAKRNMQGKVSLYYPAKKAKAEIINKETLWHGLSIAYSHSNIGEISNAITKIWNSGEITEDKLFVIKLLCMQNNYLIDYAKTLYYPTIPEEVKNKIRAYTNMPLPHFFIYAKGKDKSKVNPNIISAVDKLSTTYPAKRLNFNFTARNVGKFDYRVLMTKKMPYNADKIVEQYKLVVSEKLDLTQSSYDDNKNYLAVYANARDCIIEAFPENSEEEIVNAIIEAIFCKSKSGKKKAFWQMFGDVVYNNICQNMDNGLSICQKCGSPYVKTTANQRYCLKCQQGNGKKNKNKIVMCCDCGLEFKVSNSSRRIRCDACQKQERKRINRNYYQKQN